jgi:hypothetical protein
MAAVVIYAQAGIANWNDANGWNTVAGGGGTAYTNPQNGANTFTCHANGQTVTINVNVTVTQVDTLTTGGGFTLADGITLTAIVLAGTTTCVTFSAASPATATIAGTVTGSAATASAHGANNTGTGTLVVNGNVASGGAFNFGINNNSTGTISVTGNVTGGSSNTGCGIYNVGAGTVTVAATTVTGGTNANAFGIYNAGAGTATVTATTVSGSGNSSAIYNAGAGTATVTATTVTGGTGSGTYGLWNNSTGSITVTATTIIGGSNATAYGVYNASTGTVTAVGDATAGGAFGVNGIYNISTGHIRFHGNIVASATGAIAGTTGIASRIMAYVDAANHTTSYAEAAAAAPNYTGALVTHSGSATQAGVADVRHGTAYGPAGALVGTAYIPAAASVLLGVNVDATTGTYTVTAAAIATEVLTQANGIDTGITLAKALEMFTAFAAGKVTASSAGGVSTYTYKKRDGSTTSFTSLCTEADGLRATTGDLA